MKRLKNKTVHSKNTTRKLNNSGMTYMELLVALSLLVLIVTLFTPMLLNSYDTLYKAGERTNSAYDSRLDIEDELASRQGDTSVSVDTAFKTNAAALLNTINVKARQVQSVASGLETLYSQGKGVIKIVSDTLVKDNQSAHSVRLRLTNLDFDNYEILTTVKDFEAIKNDKTKLENKVVFYITSVFDTATPLAATIANKPNLEASGEDYFPFIDIILEDVDITYSPIQFSAYYLNDFGTMKVATAYLTITEADMIFVGKTTDTADYFTLSDVGTIDNPVIAGREMYNAPIATGEVLTDVTYNQASSYLNEGFYSMCGENGIARRLWHLDSGMLAKVEALDDTAVNKSDTSKASEPEIIYKSVSLGGANPYFQYDWAGDLNDVMAFTSSTNSTGVIEYGSSSTSDMDFGDGNYIWKNEYNVDNNYFAYNFDGFNAGHGSMKDNHRRVSYVLTATENELSNDYNIKPEDGFIIRKYDKSGYNHNGVADDSDKRYVYSFSTNAWHTFGMNFFGTSVNSIRDSESGFSGLVSGLNSGKNKQVSEGVVVVRNSAADGNAWASNENATYTSGDEKLAYVYLKSFNTISAGTLTSNSLVQAKNNTSSAKVNLSSCAVLPGTIESLYLGTLDSYGILNETKGIVAAPGNSGLSTDQGTVNSYVLIQDNGTYFKSYDQRNLINVGIALANGGKLNFTPSGTYGRDSYRTEYNNNQNIHKAETGGFSFTGMRFTMGYCSDLFVLYDGLNVRDIKPLEYVYAATYNVSDNGDTDGSFRQNIWFPREFLNITASETYGDAMIAVGYDIGGKSGLFAEVTPEFTTSTDTKYLQGDRDMDLDNDGTVDWLEADGLVTESMVNSTANKGLLWKTFSHDGKNYYIIDPNPGEDAGDEAQTMVSLPKHIVTSTTIQGVCNNGVISVYNAGDEHFSHIGYVKGEMFADVRFNCVSIAEQELSDENNGLLCAAIGGSNGKVYLAILSYQDGKILEQSLVWGETLNELPYDFDGAFASIDSIKAFNKDGDFYILVGGKSANGNSTINLTKVNWDNYSLSTHDTVVLFEGLSYDITDIIIAESYIYITAQDTNQTHGVVGVCPIQKNSEGKYDLSTDNWKFIGNYHTDFTIDKDGNLITNDGAGTTLPPLKALASTLTGDLEV